jgi:hypothetical protein
MAIKVANLTPGETDQLRELDARMRVAESGHKGWSPSECEHHIVTYGEYLEHLHEKYQLDDDEVYTYDTARGLIFEGLD